MGLAECQQEGGHCCNLHSLQVSLLTALYGINLELHITEDLYGRNV